MKKEYLYSDIHVFSSISFILPPRQMKGDLTFDAQTVRWPLGIRNPSSSVNIRLCKQAMGVCGVSREALTITSQNPFLCSHFL